MTDKTIYWNGATGKRESDEPAEKTKAELIEELVSSIAKISDALDYIHRQQSAMKAQIERLERWKGEAVLQAMTDDAERMGLYDDFSNPLKRG